MKKESSNIIVEQHLMHLQKINKVEAPAHLDDKVMAAIESKKRNAISFNSLSIAASLFVFFFCTEIYFVVKPDGQRSTDLASAYQLYSDNYLYHE